MVYAAYIYGRTAFPARFSLAEILVLTGTAGAGGMAPPTSTMISTRMKCVQGHILPVNMFAIVVSPWKSLTATVQPQAMGKESGKWMLVKVHGV